MENQPSDCGRYRLLFNRVLAFAVRLFLIYVSNMPQVVTSNLFLYADDSCLMFQHEKVEDIEKLLNNDFENICNWFVDSRLSFSLGKDETILRL